MSSSLVLYIADAVGVIGVIAVIVAYLFLQADRLDPDSLTYSVLNLVGSAFIVYSLCFNWNTPAMLVEVAWVIISLWGTIKAYKHEHHRKPRS
jgi:formate-dependent nitrite reductase membrane component NrfD